MFCASLFTEMLVCARSHWYGHAADLVEEAFTCESAQGGVVHGRVFPLQVAERPLRGNLALMPAFMLSSFGLPQQWSKCGGL